MSHMSTFQGTRPCKSNNMSERYESIRSLLKRYNRVYQDTFSLETIIQPQPFGHPVGACLGVAGPPNTFTANSYQNVSFPLITYYSAMYRAHRGSIREKFYVNLTSLADTPVDYITEVQYFPTLNLPTSIMPFTFQTPTTIINATLSTAPNSSTAGGHISITNSSDIYEAYVQPPHGARDISNHTAPFNEYEIPYVSLNNHRLIPIGGNGAYAATRNNTTNDYGFANFSEANTCGSIIATLSPAGNLADVSITGSIITYVAGGDDWRMFGLLGPAPLQYNPQLLYTGGTGTPSASSLMPDRWFSGPAQIV